MSRWDFLGAFDGLLMAGEFHTDGSDIARVGFWKYGWWRGLGLRRKKGREERGGSVESGKGTSPAQYASTPHRLAFFRVRYRKSQKRISRITERMFSMKHSF